MYLLAFDLSTTVLGYSIFNMETEELLHMDYHKFEAEDLVDRGIELFGILSNIIETYPDIGTFGIEERLKSFRSGGTNADAMLKTAQLNFLCQYIIRNQFGLPIKEVNVNTARSACFPGFHKIARTQKGVKHKLLAFAMAKVSLGEERFPTKVLKSGPRKGETIFIDEGMDMADSWVIGKAVINLAKASVKPMKKK